MLRSCGSQPVFLSSPTYLRADLSRVLRIAVAKHEPNVPPLGTVGTSLLLMIVGEVLLSARRQLRVLSTCAGPDLRPAAIPHRAAQAVLPREKKALG